jgi:hypothetical protein
LKPTEDIEKRIKNVNIIIDSESNKRVFSNILQDFEKSTVKNLAPTDQPNIWRMIFSSPLTKLAAAALIIVAASLFLGRGRHIPSGPTAEPRLIAQSSIKKMSLMSLRMAYQRGGFDALDRQFRDTLDALGPQSLSISMQELLEDANGF